MGERFSQVSQNEECFSRSVNAFRGRTLPEPARVAGYGWLIASYDLALPLPPRLAAIAGRHRPRELAGWLILPERYEPAEELAAHLVFALKWEGVDLAVLDALFRAVPADDVAAAIRSAPTSVYMRRIWFLYEWLSGAKLDLPDLGKVRAVDVVNRELQVALESGAISARHRVRNNLPGTPFFCPMVRRTAAIERWQAAKLDKLARETIGRTHPDVLARAAAFLLLSDSRASYRIEGEKPSPDRALRWGRAIARAGTTRLSLEELEALQRIVIGDARFVQLGLRADGGFVGEHDRETRAPLPDHVSARPQDLPSLMAGLVAYDERAGGGAMDPVVTAAVEAFGFVYIHPFEDGNGRIHRWLIHHVLAAAGFAPPGLAFPVSAAILREITEYRRVLESYSRPLLSCIDWRPTAQNNVEVLNDTASWYRYFDATAHAEFLYGCVEATVRHDLPTEVAFLEAYDRFKAGLSKVVDMPSGTVDLLHGFLRQGDGRLSKRAREHEFAVLTEDEVLRVEALYADSITVGSLLDATADDASPESDSTDDSR